MSTQGEYGYQKWKDGWWSGFSTGLQIGIILCMFLYYLGQAVS